MLSGVVWGISEPRDEKFESHSHAFPCQIPADWQPMQVRSKSGLKPRKSVTSPATFQNVLKLPWDPSSPETLNPKL